MNELLNLSETNVAFTPEEVALKLKLTHKHARLTICRLARVGTIQGRKVGRSWRFSPQAIDNYLLSKGAR